MRTIVQIRHEEETCMKQSTLFYIDLCAQYFVSHNQFLRSARWGKSLDIFAVVIKMRLVCILKCNNRIK